MTKMAILLIEFQVWGIKFMYIECSMCNEIASQCQICYSASTLKISVKTFKESQYFEGTTWMVLMTQFPI